MVLCALCPYNDSKKKLNVEDIESLKDCPRCPISPVKEPTAKKLKLDKVPIEVLKNDPHEQCPVQLPIGVDFMGKCPYLEGMLVAIHGKCPVNGSIENAEPVDYTKCPFLKDGKLVLQIDEEAQNVDDSVNPNNLFCGLITHKDANDDGMESARKLGERLAHNLISKGALEVMTKAQSIIHSSIGVSTSASS
ncbi:hypothetical protein NQ314_018120 [Rhamnusium bicolor]|uniref:Uncharacterized protein n=1 Tax=Rhamnusium bicolor TaxID=1586634 RepID=A0AAV8WSV0_9CUCU|nr:hypothetical protein NQ314_018120 [Rhamnusium bicolor]